MNGADSVDRLQLMRIGLYFGPACFIVLTGAWYKLLQDDLISTGIFLVLLVLNIPITLAGVALIYHTVTRASVGLAKTLLAAGDIAPPRSYPHQDMLIARGQYAEAAEFFRDHLRIDPDDCDARLRLADLLERHLADPAGAEREYLDLRRRSPDPRRQFAATNALIDLYRRIGRRDRLMVELARFADRHRGTPHGDAAARALRELKAGGPG
jgi:hypothetical protein